MKSSRWTLLILSAVGLMSCLGLSAQEAAPAQPADSELFTFDITDFTIYSDHVEFNWSFQPGAGAIVDYGSARLTLALWQVRDSNGLLWLQQTNRWIDRQNADFNIGRSLPLYGLQLAAPGNRSVPLHTDCVTDTHVVYGAVAIVVTATIRATALLDNVISAKEVFVAIPMAKVEDCFADPAAPIATQAGEALSPYSDTFTISFSNPTLSLINIAEEQSNTYYNVNKWLFNFDLEIENPDAQISIAHVLSRFDSSSVSGGSHGILSIESAGPVGGFPVSASPWGVAADGLVEQEGGSFRAVQGPYLIDAVCGGEDDENKIPTFTLTTYISGVEVAENEGNTVYRPIFAIDTQDFTVDPTPCP